MATIQSEAMPGYNINMGWQLFNKSIALEIESHFHSADKNLVSEPIIAYILPKMALYPFKFRVLSKPIRFTTFLQTAIFCKILFGKEYI